MQSGTHPFQAAPSGEGDLELFHKGVTEYSSSLPLFFSGEKSLGMTSSKNTARAFANRSKRSYSEGLRRCE